MPNTDSVKLQQQLEQENSQLESAILAYLQGSQDSQHRVLLQKLQQLPASLWPEQLGAWYPTYLSCSRQRLEQIQAALSQLKLGLYGVCADCEADIEAEVLLKDPAAQRCLCCEKKAQVKPN